MFYKQENELTLFRKLFELSKNIFSILDQEIDK